MSRRLESNRRFFYYAFVNHVLWSTLAVASRYLQVYAQPLVFDGQGVLATAKAASFLSLLVCGNLICPDDKDHGGTDRTDQVGEQSSDDERDETDGNTAQHLLPHQTSSPRTKKILFALLFGVVATCRASLNIASAKFTLSYYLNTVNSLTPIVVSIGDAVLLKTQLPFALWPCILATFVGCAIIGISQSPIMDDGKESSPESSYFSSNDAIGCALQFASMLFSATARLIMKFTEGILTRDEAVQANNVSNFLFPLLYTLVSNPQGWEAFLHILVPQNLLAWFTISVLVYTVGSTGQMSLVRSMGPGMYSSLSAIRVLGSALLSAVLLEEPVRNWVEWLGLITMMITMTLYTLAVVGMSSPIKGDHHLVDTDEEEGFTMTVVSSPQEESMEEAQSLRGPYY